MYSREQIEEILKQYISVDQGKALNQYRTKPNQYLFDNAGVSVYNALYKALKDSDLNYPLKRTDSGAIMQTSMAPNNAYAWDDYRTNTVARLTIVIAGVVWVIKLGATKDDKETVYPDRAFAFLKEEFKKDGIDLDEDKLSDEESMKVKDNIINREKLYIIDSYTKPGEIVENVHHIDFNNSFPAGLANTHPKYAKTLNRLYDERKICDMIGNKFRADFIKKALDIAIGRFHELKFNENGSVKKYPRYAQLALDAIEDNNNRLYLLASELEHANRRVIGFNTDGIWYQGEIYHNAQEGSNLGQWKHDYINCKYRARSKGCYEIEGWDVKHKCNIYKPVVRGRTSLDATKPRETWQWGDIFKAQELIYQWDKKTEQFIQVKGVV